MALPKTLKNFTTFVDGIGQLGKCEELEPPKLTVKEDDYRAGGMDTPVGIDMGLEKLACSMTFGEYSPEIMRHLGRAERANLPIVHRGATEDGAGNVEAIIITMRGGVKEQDPGSWKAGDRSKLKVMASLTYYKMEVAGRVVHEIDVENMVRVIDGEDQLAGQRAALGL